VDWPRLFSITSESVGRYPEQRRTTVNCVPHIPITFSPRHNGVTLFPTVEVANCPMCPSMRRLSCEYGLEFPFLVRGQPQRIFVPSRLDEVLRNYRCASTIGTVLYAPDVDELKAASSNRLEAIEVTDGAPQRSYDLSVNSLDYLNGASWQLSRIASFLKAQAHKFLLPALLLVFPYRTTRRRTDLVRGQEAMFWHDTPWEHPRCARNGLHRAAQRRLLSRSR